MSTYHILLGTMPFWSAALAYAVARLLQYIARRYASMWPGDPHDEYPDDRDYYAREQAIEDGKIEYER